MPSTRTSKALKAQYSTEPNLLILLKGIEAVSRLLAEVAMKKDLDQVIACDTAFLLADLTAVAHDIVAEVQS